MMRQFELDKRKITVFLPENQTDTVVYTHGVGDEIAAVCDILSEPRPVLAAVSVDWNRELSPWPAKKVFSGGEDFAGGADGYLTELTGRIIPAIEAEIPFPVKTRCIAGYSLAGLFAVYSSYKADCFDRFASVSGSLWFDGFVDFVKTGDFRRQPERCYFSLGDREKISKNPRMAAVEDCTLDIVRLLQEKDIDTAFEFNPGGHFSDIPKRIAKGITYITK